MDCFYMPIECQIGYRRTYGIAAVDVTDGEKIILGALIDVAKDRKTVEILADQYNMIQISLELFYDAIMHFVDEEK